MGIVETMYDVEVKCCVGLNITLKSLFELKTLRAYLGRMY